MKNKFFSIMTALLLTLAIVSHGAIAIDATAFESGISVCADETGDDIFDEKKDPHYH